MPVSDKQARKQSEELRLFSVVGRHTTPQMGHSLLLQVVARTEFDHKYALSGDQTQNHVGQSTESRDRMFTRPRLHTKPQQLLRLHLRACLHGGCAVFWEERSEHRQHGRRQVQLREGHRHQIESDASAVGQHLPQRRDLGVPLAEMRQHQALTLTLLAGLRIS